MALPSSNNPPPEPQHLYDPRIIAVYCHNPSHSNRVRNPYAADATACQSPLCDSVRYKNLAKVALRPREENVRISGPNTAAIARTMLDIFRFQYRPAPLSFSAQPGVTCTITEVHAFLEPYLDISM
jgi:hypothetical protein